VINYPSDVDDQSSNFSPEIFYGCWWLWF
jgi:hypothetical protein